MPLSDYLRIKGSIFRKNKAIITAEGSKICYFCIELFIMDKIEHIGIAVKSITEANEIYKSLFGYEQYKTETVESEGVSTSFFKCGNSKIELLEATRDDSPIAKFIEKKGEGIHHIAFAVSDIDAEVKRLKDEGFRILNETPKKGADGKLVVFLHPKSTHGVLVELCQDIEQ